MSYIKTSVLDSTSMCSGSISMVRLRRLEFVPGVVYFLFQCSIVYMDNPGHPYL